jgi:hypothetical protein
MYNKFVSEVEEESDVIEEVIITDSKLDNMNISQKWLYLIFKKDTY